jgi:GT2 family glycosyltransferase
MEDTANSRDGVQSTMPLANVAVIVCSADRPLILHETLASLAPQTRPPKEVLVCVPDEASVLPATRFLPRTRVIVGPRGSSVQRNFAIDRLTPGADLVLFLDDDVELARNFIATISDTFAGCPEVVVVGGVDIGVGWRRGTLTRMTARGLVATVQAEPALRVFTLRSLSSLPSGLARRAARRIALASPPDISVLAKVPAVEGCAMCVRNSLLNHVRFDEHLTMYGYLEDLDFSAQCRRFGLVVIDTKSVLVHLVEVRGRIPDVQMGFSQVMNPVYIWSKGNASFCRTVLLGHLVARPLANLWHSTYNAVARRRLKGNLLAFSRLLRGTLEPGILRVPN